MDNRLWGCDVFWGTMECAKMELDEFVELTLKQILQGIKKAQASEDGGNISPLLDGKPQMGGNLVALGDYGMFTRVDFDVSVSAEKSGGGTAKLAVFGVGAEAGGAIRSAAENRITFSVGVRIPEGDTSKTEALREKHEARQQALRARRSRTRVL